MLSLFAGAALLGAGTLGPSPGCAARASPLPSLSLGFHADAMKVLEKSASFETQFTFHCSVGEPNKKGDREREYQSPTWDPTPLSPPLRGP